MNKLPAPVVNYKLPVMLMRDANYFVAYTPALDLSVQGKTKAQVQQRFGEAVLLFFEELHRMGSMDEVLEELGWRKLPAKTWQPPTVVDDSPTEIEVPVPAYA
jgi:hypothetical protein